jgi:Domain of Unknown Function (DUF928)
MKHFLHFAVLSIAVSTTAILPNLSGSMSANSAPILLSQNVNFKPPDVKAPDNRQGATHRGTACQNDLSIIPLIPPSNSGLTLTESPTFFAYVSKAATPVEFTLQIKDTEGTKIYQTAFTVDKPGVVGVSIPADGDNKKSLEVGKEYQWSFAVVCNPEQAKLGDRSGDYFVEGYVQRIEPESSLKNELANPDPMAKAIVYAKNEIWYDTVATLAQMRRKAPDDAKLTAEWRQLLQSQKLDSIADKPLVQSF